jgi:hypothetical protein
MTKKEKYLKGFAIANKYKLLWSICVNRIGKLIFVMLKYIRGPQINGWIFNFLRENNLLFKKENSVWFGF